MDELDARRYGMTRRGLGGMGEGLMDQLISAGTAMLTKSQQTKAAEAAASVAKAQQKTAAALAEAEKQRALQAQAAAAPAQPSTFKKYLPYIAVGAVAVGVGLYFMSGRKRE